MYRGPSQLVPIWAGRLDRETPPISVGACPCFPRGSGRRSDVPLALYFTPSGQSPSCRHISNAEACPKEWRAHRLRRQLVSARSDHAPAVEQTTPLATKSRLEHQLPVPVPSKSSSD